MYKFMFQIIENKEHIFWGELISTALCQQICNVGTSVPFYMNSYLVYIAAAIGSFSGLSTKGDRLQVPVWEYYDQITLANSKYHYRRVQDAFFGHYRCLFDKQLCIKRVSDAAWEKVNQYGCIFLQFTTFTYLRVGYFKGEPYTLPRYATDRIILMELARQLMDVQNDQHASHRPGFGIIGPDQHASHRPLKPLKLNPDIHITVAFLFIPTSQ